MLVVRVVLLLAAVVGVLLRPGRLPAWVVPVAAVAVGLAVGAVAPGEVPASLRPLAAALGFLLAAVPLSMLLDALGFFESLARVVSTGRRTGLGLWLVAAGVTAVLNLDASVVLLTPLYVRIARRSCLDVVALAFQPVLLASLASSALPVSNLTNLIAVGRTGATTTAFITHLGPPTVLAVAVGYWCWRRALPLGEGSPAPVEAAQRRPLVLGGAVVGAVLIGFVAGPVFGVQPWEVAVGADVLLVALVRRLPVSSVPLGTALVAAGLAVLAEAAVSHVDVGHVLHATGTVGLLRTTGIAVAGADVANNLPAVLVSLPGLPSGSSPTLWAVLLGVNLGPALVVSGSLAGLLWSRTAASLGVEVGPAHYSRVGLLVGLPALVVAAAALVVLQLVLPG
ncbi:MAG: SLC13 family permease [Acidimicrobiales bacterium]